MLMSLAEETAAHQKKLEARCAGYRTVIQELQKQLQELEAGTPSEEARLQYLLNEYGI